MKTPSSRSPLEDAPRAPFEWARAAGMVEPVIVAIERYAQRRHRRRRALIAAAALLVVGASTLWQTGGSRTAEAAGAPLVRMQPQRQVLPDGSVVDLAPDAVMSVRFTSQLREVWLTAGQAHFEVEKDAARPFVVVAGTVGVRAVGTAFTVQHGSGQVEVLVTEGRVSIGAHADPVALAEAQSGSDRAALVTAGQRLVVDLGVERALPAPLPVSAEEQRARLAWRVPRLEFSGTPLGEVVAQFNVYSGRLRGERLVLADPALQRLPLSGTLRADNIPVLLRILEDSYGITARPTEHGELALVRRQ